MIKAPTPDLEIFNRFFQKITLRLNDPCDPVLEKYIRPPELKEIFDYLIQNQIEIKAALKHNKVADRFAYRFRKGKTARTFAIIQNIDNELILTLETKRKLATNKRNPKAFFQWSEGRTVKVSFRLDVYPPQKWKSTVYSNETNVAKAIKEAMASQSLCNKWLAKKENDLPLHSLLWGPKYTSKHTKKITIYEPFSKALENFLISDWKKLTEQDFHRITKNLLKALHFLHQQKLAYQLLYPDNILFFQDQKGFHAKIKISEPMHAWETNDMCACPLYESPEIRFVAESDTGNFGKFWRKNNESYGRYLFDKLKTERPDLSTPAMKAEFRKCSQYNDCFALGLILYSLYTGVMISTSSDYTAIENEKNPLIQGLLQPLRQNRFTIHVAKNALKKYKDPLQKKWLREDAAPKINRLLTKVQCNLDALKRNFYQSKLSSLISIESLDDIYHHLLSKEKEMKAEMAFTPFSPNSTLSMRFPAEGFLLRRSLQITEDLSGELVLFLETKSKTNFNTKSQKPEIYKGHIKTSKPCWRIDTPQPEPWMSSVVHDFDNVTKTSKEAYTTQQLCKEVPNEFPERPFPIQFTLIGSSYIQIKSEKSSLAIYSPRAENSLELAFYYDWRKFTDKDILRMTFGLLYALKIMHDRKMSHQDLHLSNILVFRDKEGLYIKVIDLEFLLPFGHSAIQAPRYFEPPEFHFLENNLPLKIMYNLYSESYGSYLFERYGQQCFTGERDYSLLTRVHPGNDIFQVGIVLYLLFTGISHRVIIPKHLEAYDNPFIRGMLKVNPHARLSANEALKLLSAYAGVLKTPTLSYSNEPAALTEFFAKMNEQLHGATKIPGDFLLFIHYHTLLEVYHYILRHRETIVRYFAQQIASNSAHFPFSMRIEKQPLLQRTVQIVTDIKGKLALILQTKRKDANKNKSPHFGVKVNPTQTKKPCWRIDTREPEFWQEITTAGHKNIETLLQEPKVLQERNKNSEEDITPDQYALVGCIYPTKTRPKMFKVSVFSPQPKNTPEKACTTLEENMSQLQLKNSTENTTKTFTPGYSQAITVGTSAQSDNPSEKNKDICHQVKACV